MKDEEKYKKKPKLADTFFAKRLESIQALSVEYDVAVEKHNLITDVLKRLEWNQFDKEIIEFHKSVSAYGVSDGEWKIIIKRGLEDCIFQLNKKICKIGDDLGDIIKT